jgi:hypothetical protein
VGSCRLDLEPEVDVAGPQAPLDVAGPQAPLGSGGLQRPSEGVGFGVGDHKGAGCFSIVRRCDRRDDTGRPVPRCSHWHSVEVDCCRLGCLCMDWCGGGAGRVCA